MCSAGQTSFNTVDGEVTMKVIPFQELVASNPEPRNWRANIISVLGTRLIWSPRHAQTLHFQWLILDQLNPSDQVTGVRQWSASWSWWWCSPCSWWRRMTRAPGWPGRRSGWTTSFTASSNPTPSTLLGLVSLQHIYALKVTVKLISETQKPPSDRPP